MDFDLKINHEMIPLSEVVYDGISEQGIELDYILPDYYPDIFKLIKCEAFPEILSYSVTENKLNFDLSVNIIIWYCSENSNELSTIRQKMTYSKTQELGQDITGAEVLLRTAADYVNCRVVNKKRIDIKGAVTTKIKLISEKQQEMICGAEGMNIQLRKIPVEYSLGKLSADKTAVINENVEMNPDKPSVVSIIRSCVFAGEPECKVIANKLVVKGNAQISILYSCEDSGKPSMDTMKYTIPYSQIIDMEGLDETYQCCVEATAVNCDISPSAAKTFKCEFSINMHCSAIKTSHTEIITDLYSTKYDSDYQISKVRICKPPVPVNEHINMKYVLEYNDGTIEKVYDVWCSAKNISVKADNEENAICMSGMLKFSALVRNSEGKPVLIEKENACEHRIMLSGGDDGFIPESDAFVENCTYTLSSGNKISVSSDIVLRGKLCRFSETDAVTDINVDSTSLRRKEGNYAAKIYFGNEGENVWDIAKKYGTSVEAVMEENEQSDEILAADTMLLIPIVN